MKKTDKSRTLKSKKKHNNMKDNEKDLKNQESQSKVQDSENKEQKATNNEEKQTAADVDKEPKAGQNEENKEAQKESEQTKKEEINWEQKYKELNDRHLRLNAEYDNYRKRTAKEKADMIKTAGEKIISDILPVVDNFERAIDNMKEGTDVNALKEGVELILKQLLSTMKSFGVEQIKTEDAEFDTDLHEAIAKFPAQTPEQKNKIIDCTTKGYTMHGKVIRHAKVVVGA